jgi:2-alkyl-3-oxoalkanoate reductase
MIERGHQVTATTRSKEKASELGRLGATPAVMDGLDPEAVATAVTAARPDAIIHRMTALSGDPDLKRFDR